MRKSSFEKNKIYLKKHQEWLKNVRRNKKNKIFIFYLNNIKAGQARFEKITHGYKLDYSISNEFRGMNYGSKMLKLIINNTNIDNIYAMTKKNNFSSIKCLKRSNFKKINSRKFVKFYFEKKSVNA